MAPNDNEDIHLDEFGHQNDWQEVQALSLDKLQMAILDVPPSRLLEKPLLSEDGLREIRHMLNRPSPNAGQEQCSRPRCKNKAWSGGIGAGVICRKHTEENFRLSGVPTLFNWRTYICQMNKMRLEVIVNNFQSLRAHWRNCPQECKVDSCHRLIGIPRAR